MGLHRAAQRPLDSKFFDVDLRAGARLALPNAFEVDFNKRAEIDAGDLETKAVNLRIRELMADGYGTIVIRNPGAKHSIAVGILNRLNLIIDGSLGYFGCACSTGRMCGSRAGSAGRAPKT